MVFCSCVWGIGHYNEFICFSGGDMKYPLIKKLGLYTYEKKNIFGDLTEYIQAYDLEMLLQNATVVTGFKDDEGQLWFGTDDNSGDTHKALLINIEELVKKPCKHIPQTHRQIIGSPLLAAIGGATVKCLSCGVELVAEWKAKD